jgi:hypothetical protein
MAFFGLSDITISRENNKGPLSELFTDKYGTSNTFRYPIDVGNYDKAHYMVIHIFEQKNTQFTGIQQDKGGAPSVAKNEATPGSVRGLPNIKEKFSSAINSKIDSAFSSVNTAVGGKLSFFKASKPAFSATDAAAATKDNKLYIDKVDQIQKTGFINTTQRTTDSIALYMPDTLQFTYSQSYENLEMGKELAGQSFAVGADQLEKLKSGQETNVAGALKAAVLSGVAKAGGDLVGSTATAKALIFKGLGGIVNPMLEMLYSSPDFRTFQFEFLFYPRDEREALEVQNIMERLRFHQAPEIDDSSAGVLLIPPSEFELQFYYAGKPNPNLPPIARCVLTNISIDYAPNGWSSYEMPGEFSPALGRTGMPSAIRMTLEFKETQFLTKRDFGGKKKVLQLTQPTLG